MLSKSLITFLALLPVLSVHAWSPPRCRTTYERKEWRTLSSGEQQTYLRAVRRLMDTRFYDDQTSLHQTAAEEGDRNGLIHGSPQFLPWHRWFLWKFEAKLQERNRDIAIPYWDTAYDSQAPEFAPVWGDDLFGGNGVGDDMCVVTGHFKDWRPRHTTFPCFTRRWNGNDGGISRFESPETINGIIARNDGDYDGFRNAIEDGTHGTVHINIGGDMAELHSPNDPIFYLHHANVDRQWAVWQNLNDDNMNAYSGRREVGRRSTAVSKSDILTLTGRDSVRVRDVMDTRKLCYVYKEMTMEEAKLVDLPQGQTGETRNGGDDDLVRRGTKFISPLIKFVRRDDKAGAAKDVKKVDPTIILEKATDAAAPLKPQTKVEIIKPADPNIKAAVVKPVDEHVTVVKAPPVKEEVKNTGGQLMLNKLCTCPPLPEKWLLRNKLSIEKARIHEKIAQNTTQEINKIPGYVSRAALWNRPDMMVRVVGKKGANDFVCDVNGTRIVVTKGTGSKSNPEQAAANIITRVQKSLDGKVQQPIAQVAEKLAKVIGPPVVKDPKDSSNPFAPRTEGGKGISKDSEEGKKLEKKVNVVPLKKLEEKVTKEDIKEMNSVAKQKEQKAEENKKEFAKKTEELAKELKGKGSDKKDEKKGDEKKDDKKSEEKKDDKKDDKKPEEKKEEKKDEKKPEEKKDDKKEEKKEDYD